MSRVVMVGAGIVGVADGRALTGIGHDVSYVDTDTERVAALAAEGLHAGGTIDLSGAPAYVVLTVPTPADDRGYDLSALEDACRAVGAAMRDSSEVHTVVVRSTVPPGTCAGVVVPALEQSSGRALGSGFRVAHSPEYLRKASADADAQHPVLTLVASLDAATRDDVRALLEPLGGEVVVMGDFATAELAKCAHNAWNATKISFFNQLWLLAQATGVDAELVAETVVASAEASFNPAYGTVGGEPFRSECLEKDLDGLIAFARDEDVPAPMLEAVVAVNEILAKLREQR